MNKILIVGGTGFIGSYLVDLMSAQKELSLSVLYRDEDLKFPHKANVEYYKVDLSQRLVPENVKDCDAVIWLAPPNMQAVKNLTAASFTSLKKIIYASTLLVYPDSDKPVPESVLPHPGSEYEADKLSEENAFLSLFAGSEISVCIARLGNVYGDIKNKGRVDGIIRAIEKNKTFTVKGDGKNIRDYIFVEDVAALLKSLLFYEQKERADIFNVCTGVGISTNELIKTVEQVLGKNLRFEYNRREQEKSVVGDNSKIVRISSFAPRDFRSGLGETLENYLPHLKI